MSKSSDFFFYQGKNLTTENVALSEITKATGTPVYIYSAAALLKPLKELQTGLAAVDHLVCFAVKSNSNIALLKLLSESGAGMDLVSEGELFRVKRAGVASDKIVFSGVGKTTREMKAALQQGIFSFNVESKAELATLNQVALLESKTAKVALRFNPDIDAKTHPYISTGLKKNKFGLNEKEILDIAKNHSQYPGVVIAGISIHIGSQILSLSPLNQAFLRLKKLIRQLGKILPTQLTFVDLGGGIGITYKNEKTPSLKKYCELILKHFGPRSKDFTPLKILIEPGRTISGNAGVLVSEVLFRKGRGKKDFLIIDAGMNDLIRPALYQSHHEIIPLKKEHPAGKKIKTDIVGPVCESSDCFASDRSLSSKLTSGDLLAILSAGAYGYTMSNNYNTRPRPPEVLVQGDTYTVIKTRESYEDLIRGENY